MLLAQLNKFGLGWLFIVIKRKFFMINGFALLPFELGWCMVFSSLTVTRTLTH